MEEQLGSEAGSSSEDQFSETELGIEELQLALRAMQFRRFVNKGDYYYYYYYCNHGDEQCVVPSSL